jgi:hypothetical protein
MSSFQICFSDQWVRFYGIRKAPHQKKTFLKTNFVKQNFIAFLYSYMGKQPFMVSLKFLFDFLGPNYGLFKKIEPKFGQNFRHDHKNMYAKKNKNT